MNGLANIALVLLASGESKRFGPTDKLLAELKGKPVLSYAARSLRAHPKIKRIAIVRSDSPQTRTIVEKQDWDIVENASPQCGQGHSIALAMQHIARLEASAHIEAVIFILADMPNIEEAYLLQMIDALGPGIDAIMSSSAGTLCPPALFAKSIFAKLSKLEGDRGGKNLFKTLKSTKTLSLPKGNAVDIDTPRALNHVETSMKAGAV